jgi:4-hydroxy-tetrahydrodipicolinate reductase
MRVGVNGAAGRMGRTVCAAVDADSDLTLAAAVDKRGGSERVGGGIAIAEHLHEFADAGCDVVVDFTVAAAARTTVPWLGIHGIHAVVGTTGFDIGEIAAMPGDGNVLVAPNFAIGAVLMMRFATEASRIMARAEIIELHHDRKLDAPSGTAARTAELMEGDVPVHSVRLPGLVAHQEVILGDVGQTLTIRHDSTDRTSFMPGVLLAVRRIGGLGSSPVVGLEALLFDDA